MNRDTRKYEMRVTRINQDQFNLKLVDTSVSHKIVYETISNVIPSTLELIFRYNRLKSF